MILLQRILGINGYISLRKHVCCRFGFHGPRTGPDGTASNFCCWGCGLAFNQNAWQDYTVRLKNGEVFEVKATNEYHAGSKVVYGYGEGRMKIDSRTGRPPHSAVKVHRDNIASICLKSNHAGLAK